MPNDNPKGFRRNLTNYGDRDFALYLRRSFARSMGYSLEMLDRPIVGIAQTASGFNNCHRYVPELVEAVKRGVIKAGGLPLEFPTISLGEIFLNPTSLVFRNLMSMDTEEMIRAQPMDACVLVGGCDKTVPAQLMGPTSRGSSLAEDTFQRLLPGDGSFDLARVVRVLDRKGALRVGRPEVISPATRAMAPADAARLAGGRVRDLIARVRSERAADTS